MGKININDVNECGKFAIILKCLIAKNKITQGELASRTGLSEATISHYVKGKFTPSQTNIEKIANALNVSPRAFYGDIDDYEPYLNSLEVRFATRLNALIKENGMTQEQFAKEIGVSRQTANSYLNAKSLPMSDVAFRIAERFGTTVGDLLGEKSKIEGEKEMQVVVVNMPEKKHKCKFAKPNITNDYCECKLSGGMCDLVDGKCSNLTEVVEN